MKGAMCSLRFMEKFEQLIREGKTDKELAAVLCFDESEVFRLRKALETRNKVVEKAKDQCDISILGFNKVRPSTYYEISRVPEEHQVDLAIKSAKEKLTVDDVKLEVDRLLGSVTNPFPTEKKEEAKYDFECPCGRRYKIEWEKKTIQEVTTS